MAEGNSYKALVEMIGGRLKGIDGRLEGIDERLSAMDERVTKATTATHKEITELRKTVNEEQALQDERISENEKYVNLRRAIERGCIWILGTAVAVSGIVAGLIKFIIS